MQHDAVPHGHAITYDARIDSVVDMQDAAILNAGFIAHADVVDITANGDEWPYTGTFADNDVANYLGAGIDVCGGCYTRHNPAVGSKHDEWR